jgi:hypothetical protein
MPTDDDKAHLRLNEATEKLIEELPRAGARTPYSGGTCAFTV